MNASWGTPVVQASKATRSSLACVPCRSRHSKCDGSRPGCSRCSEAGQDCHYAPSRRGGLDRAALVEQRRQRHAAAQAGAIRVPDTQFLAGARQEPPLRNQVTDIPDQDACGSSAEVSISSGNEAPSALSTGTVQVHFDNIQSDRLVNSYYQNFHIFHPFLLPQKHLVRLYQDPGRQLQLKPLIAFIRFIGEIYASGTFSTTLEHYAETCLSQARPLDPILVQCQMLYSITLYWSDRKTDAMYQIDNAVRLAVDLQMYQKEFPLMHGGADSILVECWRRTWWMLYIVDTYYSGTFGSMRTGLADIEPTVELPCEELEYGSGVRKVHIPWVSPSV